VIGWGLGFRGGLDGLRYSIDTTSVTGRDSSIRPASDLTRRGILAEERDVATRGTHNFELCLSIRELST